MLFTIKFALAQLINIVIWMIIIKSLMTWFPNTYTKRVYEFLDNLTAPVEAPFRKMLGSYMGPVDFSPAVTVFALILIRRLMFMFL